MAVSVSRGAALLAAYRQAIVQTGDYTGDRKNLDTLGGTLGDTADKTKYASIKPAMQKVKDDSYAAEKFLTDNGGTPHFLALVGGAIELPQYICDIHTKYKFWDLQIDYVPSDTPLGTLRTDVDYSRFVKPDVAVGRIIADDVLDATLLLTRTFFRKEWLPGGKYAALAPAGWEKRSVVFDGHRLNQPDEGGPDASPNEPFHPAGEVQAYFTKAGLNSDYVYPRDETKSDTSRPVRHGPVCIHEQLRLGAVCGARRSAVPADRSRPHRPRHEELPRDRAGVPQAVEFQSAFRRVRHRVQRRHDLFAVQEQP